MRRAEANNWDTIETLPITGAGVGLNRHECLSPLFPLTRNSDAFVSSIETGYTYDFFDNYPDDATDF